MTAIRIKETPVSIGQDIEESIEPVGLYTEETFGMKWKRKFGKITGTIVATVLMFLIALFLVVSCFIYVMPTKMIIALIIVSIFLFIPSIYVGVVLYNTFIDTPGYSIDRLPRWEDAF